MALSGIVVKRALPIWIAMILFLWTSLVSVGVASELQRFDFEARGMGTSFHCIGFATGPSEAKRAFDACYDCFRELDSMLTDYDSNSELLRLCDESFGYPRPVSRSLFNLLKRSVELADLTHGAFDPTCGHLSQLWRRAKRKQSLPAESERLRGLSLTDWRRIQLHLDSQRVSLVPGTRLDLGGIAKGFAADACLRVLREHGMKMAVVQVGGDTAVGDPPPGATGWPIQLHRGIQKDQDALVQTITASNCGVSTSGDYYQYAEINGQRYSHILSTIDTGLGVTQRIACSVQAQDGTTSDAIATALCVMEHDARQAFVKEHPEYRVWSDKEIDP